MSIFPISLVLRYTAVAMSMFIYRMIARTLNNYSHKNCFVFAVQDFVTLAVVMLTNFVLQYNVIGQSFEALPSTHK